MPPPPSHYLTPALLLQVNVVKIEANLSKLEEKLAHEKSKFAEYDAVLKEHEGRSVCCSPKWQGSVRGLGFSCLIICQLQVQRH